MNQLRALLLERGISVPQGPRKLEQHLTAMECGDVRLSPRIQSLIADMQAEWTALDRRIAAFDDEFATHAKTDDTAHRLASIPGIGVLNATARLRQSAMRRRLHVDATSLPGSAWYRGR